MIIRYFPGGIPPQLKPLVVPALSFHPTGMASSFGSLHPLTGFSIDQPALTKDQFKAAFRAYHPDWHQLPAIPPPKGVIAPKGEYSTSPHRGDLSDILSAGYAFCKPSIDQALSNMWEQIQDEKSRQKVWQGALVLSFAAGLLGYNPSRKWIFGSLDGTDLPVPGLPWITIAVGPKSWDSGPRSKLLPVQPIAGKAGLVPFKVTIDLAEFGKWQSSLRAHPRRDDGYVRHL